MVRNRHILVLSAALLVACDGTTTETTVRCGQGSVECAGACVRPATDSLNCGACGNACGAGRVCSLGGCALTCASPLATCGTTEESRYCADVRADPANCGGCGAPCSAGEACVEGGCIATCAGAGGTLCGGSCVDLDTDDANCGGCGQACQEGTACRSGTCTSTCPPPQLPCGGTCTDLRVDPANCGACGRACPGDAVCRSGSCAAPPCTSRLGLPAGPVPSYSGGDRDSALSDLDGDGVAELVSADFAGKVIEIRHTLPSGSLGDAARTVLPYSPDGLAAGDVDGDGDVDLVVTMPLADQVALLRNTGGGGFDQTLLPFGKMKRCALGDLDGDGDLDLVLTSVSGDAVLVAANPGNGTFASPVAYASGRPGARQVLLADMDADGALDVVVGNHPKVIVAGGPEIDNGSVSVFLGLGDGTLDLPVAFALGGSPDGVAVADMDADGWLDVVAASFSMDAVVVMPNDGLGGLLTGTPTPVDRPLELAVGDLDADGLPDVVVNRYSDDVVVFRNAGLGVLGPPEVFLAGTPARLHVADATGDGVADIVVTGVRPRVLVGEAGTFAAPVAVEGGGMLLVDMDGDGRGDLLSFAGFEARIARGNGDGTFASPIRIPAPGGASELVAGDLDGDGLPDLVHRGTYVFARRNLGGLAFAPEEPLPSGIAPTLALLDLDGDGDLDLVQMYNVSVTGPVAVSLNDGHGSFSAPIALDAGFAPRYAAAGDLTGDGIPELAVANRMDSTVSVFRGLGGGAFAPSLRLAAPENPSALAILDVNADGQLDLVVSGWWSSASLRMFRGGIGGLEAPIEVPLVNLPKALLVADVDSDGWDDLIVGGVDVAVLRTVPGVGLAAPVLYEGGRRIAWVAGDVDGDLRPDVVVTGEWPGGVAVLRNRCIP